MSRDRSVRYLSKRLFEPGIGVFGWSPFQSSVLLSSTKVKLTISDLSRDIATAGVFLEEFAPASADIQDKPCCGSPFASSRS